MSKTITDEKKIDEILDRGTIVKILPNKKDFKKKLLSGEKLRFYIGFDPTAPTLHLSHAKNLILLEKFRKLGHEVIVLFGDFTARIGDPTDERSARKQLSKEDVQKNVEKWKKLVEPLMNFKDKTNPPKIKFNSSWLSGLSLEEIIGLASNFTVQQMAERDMFEKRINANQPVFLHEFLYPLMQGYDSVAMDVDVELCGTDQIFNALAGRALLKKIKSREKFVVAVTLMENPKTGELMSKSKGAGVFLDVSASEMYGQIMSQPDEMMDILYLNVTSVPVSIFRNNLKTLSPRDSKMKLAKEIVSMYHGPKKADEAEKSFINTFQKGEVPEDIESVGAIKGQALQDVVVGAGLVPSNSQFARLIRQGAVRLVDKDEVQIKDPKIKVSSNLVLKIGKKRFLKIKLKKSKK